MDEYLSEKEQVEKLRQWWSENGRFIITGLVLGLAILFGWRQWVEYRENRLASASLMYDKVAEAVAQGDRDQAFILAGELEAQYGNTPYLAQAALAIAKLHMQADEPEDAAAQLEKALAATSDEQLAEVARLRLARVLLYQQKAQRALDTLAKGGTGSFLSSYEELRGDALQMLGRPGEAREAYERALAAMQPAGSDRRLLEMKLADLAAGPAAPSTADSGL